MKHLKQRRGPLFCTPQHIMEGSDRWVSMAEDMDSYQNDPCLRATPAQVVGMTP